MRILSELDCIELDRGPKNGIPTELTLEHEGMIVIRLRDSVEGMDWFSKVFLQPMEEANGPLVSMFSLDRIRTAIVRLGNRIILSREIDLIEHWMGSV